ncbi:MAG TPA: VanW family protein, partial [Candidatus Acidoferrales bacterium]|nr:VanW family protein [Candidatus Acidoferrales bacterium]
MRALSWSLAIIPLTVVCVALAIFFTADQLYADRALPGVTVAGVDVGSLTRAATLDRLQTELGRPWAESTITATYGAHTWATTNGALAVNPDLVAAADAALSYGKTDSFADRLTAWADALRGDARVSMVLRASGNNLDRWLDQIAAELDSPAVSGAIGIGANGLVVTEPVVGQQLDKTATAAMVLAAQSLGDRNVDLAVRAVYPDVDESGFRDALVTARNATTPLTVTVEDRRVTEDAAGLASLLVIDRLAAKPGDLPALPAGAIVPATRYRYTVSLDEARLVEWVKALGQSLDRPAISAKYAVSKEGALAVVPGTNGIRLDAPKMLDLMRTGLLSAPTDTTRQIAAPSIADGNAFTTQMAQEWLPRMVKTSTFTTSYPLSASRHANISTGASQFDGIVIMPGQSFSFWNLLGPVTVERGYAYAGAIIENKSDENVIGGGLCQVSTTIFNAVSKLGYQIDERHAHGYLIERYPMGLDAAVFDPGVDFRWTNDTSSPVFL